MICDLHSHSTCSDGSLSPAELARAGKEAGLSALAITDHNTVKGIPEFTAAAVCAGIIPVPGIELAVDYQGMELHMLGLFLSDGCCGELEQRLRNLTRRRRERNCEMVAALQQDGYPISMEELETAYPSGNLNRAHFAAWLVQQGCFADTGEAFRTVLAETGPYYRENVRPDALEFISFLRDWGAVPVLAHIFLNLRTPASREKFLTDGKKAGLLGMETLYTTFTPEQNTEAAELAQHFGLLPSGGSDFHGTVKPGIQLGRGYGDLSVPGSYYENLRSLASV